MNQTAHVEKKFLVTGGAGFIGSHLCERLLDAGHRVRAVDNLTTGSRDNIRHLLANDRFQFVEADICDSSAMQQLVEPGQTIVHLAAAVGVKLIVDAPVQTIETNVLGTLALLRAALRHKCLVMLASSSEVYGKGIRLPFAEDDDVTLGPTTCNRWAYAASKMVDEFLALAYHAEQELPVIVFRLFNTIGPRQTGHYGMVVPRLMGQALRGEPLTVYGDGRQTRCFCDIRNVVEALLRLADSNESVGQVINIGSQEEISIRELASQVIAVTGSHSPLILVPFDEAYAPGFEDMQRRVPDTSRITSLLGWQPRHTLRTSLEAIRDEMLQRDTERE